MPEEKFIQVSRTARVYTHGDLSEKTKRIWLVAHGYGMLSEYFIKKFEDLDPQTNFVLAPEGLSKAYIDGMMGRVGASWMTKEMRKEEIGDYLNYFDHVVDELTSSATLGQCQFIAFGFSQGAATISRWVHHTTHKIDAMVLCGGAPAKELFSVKCFDNLPILFAFGDKDVYLNPSNKERLKEQSEEKGWSFSIIQYQGGHHITSPLLSTICEKL